MPSVQMVFAQVAAFCLLNCRTSFICQIAPLWVGTIQVRTTQILAEQIGTPKPSEN
jgi:hypothetical protein